MAKIQLANIKINPLTFNQALNEVRHYLNTSGQHQILTANPEILLESLNNQAYANLINQCDLVVADGIGLIWAAKYLSLPAKNKFIKYVQLIVSLLALALKSKYLFEVIPERLTGVDLMEKICEIAGQKNQAVYFLGGHGGVAEICASKLKQQYHNLTIAGAEDGPVDFNDASNEEFNLIFDRINNSGAQILFVAFGAPKQDFFIQKLFSNLKPQTSNLKIGMGVGGSFDYLSGQVKRAPQLYRDLGLEWLFRLINEPWRASRIFNATFRFIYYIVKYK